MNLGKLLGAGRSFFGGRVTVSYREDKRVYLPKFNADKNPFEGQSRPAEAAPPDGGTKPAARPAAPVEQPVRPAATAMTARGSLAGHWAGRLNPFRGAPAAAAALARPVQTELSLRSVKVLHNDLTDADVQRVSVKSRTVAVDLMPRLLPGREPLEMTVDMAVDLPAERRLELA